MPRLSDVYARIIRNDAGEFRLVGDSVVLDQTCRAVVTVRDERGQPLVGVPVTDRWPDGAITLETNAHGQVEFFFGPEAKFWPPNIGPHEVYVGAEKPESDIVSGLGLPEGRHADYQLTFARAKNETEKEVLRFAVGPYLVVVYRRV